MLSILKFSGGHWARAAAAWLLFTGGVAGLAEAGSETADAKVAAYNAAVALGVLDVSQRLGQQGQYQVAKVEVVDFDLQQMDPAGFADQDHTGPVEPR